MSTETSGPVPAAPSTIRLFVAVDPSGPAVADLAAAVRRLRTVPRRVRPELWHVTLAFLGEVDQAALPAVEGAIAEAAEKSRPGTLRIGGGGRFGASVLWAGLRGDTDALRALAAALRNSLRGADLLFDERPYRPHVTIGRPAGRATAEQLRADLELLGRYRGPSWPLDEIHLVRSYHQRGAAVQHERLSSWHLTG